MYIDNTDESIYDIIIEHGNEKLKFNGNLYRPNRVKGKDLRDREDPFQYFNMFIQWINDPAIEEALFKCYESIYNYFLEMANVKMLRDVIKVEVEEIYSMIRYQDMFTWIRTISGLEPPDDIERDYNGKDKDTTYIRKDYWELMILSMMIRPMVPIWTVFFGRTRDINLKENYMLEMIAGTELIELESVLRLKTYIKEISTAIWKTEKEGFSTTAILTGLGEIESIEHSLASAMIKKLAIGEVSRDPNTRLCSRGNLVSNIYRLVDNNIKNLHKRQSLGKVQNKVDKNKKDAAEDNNSLLDGYKVKQSIPDGDRVLVSHLGKRAEINARLLEPTIDLQLVRDCVESAFRREIDPVTESQGTLIKYVIDPVIEAKSVGALNKKALTVTMGVCQAILIHRGFLELATLVASVPEVMEDDIFGGDTNFMSFGDIESRNNAISKHLVDTLVDQYPCYKQPISRQGSVKSANPAINIVEKMAKDFLMNNWKQIIPSQYKSIQEPWVCPPNIRDVLANFIINRNENIYQSNMGI